MFDFGQNRVKMQAHTSFIKYEFYLYIYNCNQKLRWLYPNKIKKKKTFIPPLWIEFGFNSNINEAFYICFCFFLINNNSINSDAEKTSCSMLNV